jgi:hypothetical protein
MGFPLIVTTSPTATESFVKPSGPRTDAAPASTSMFTVDPSGFFELNRHVHMRISESVFRDRAHYFDSCCVLYAAAL